MGKRGAALVLPWSTAVSVITGGGILVYLSTFLPVRAATQIQPSEALRS